MTPDQKAAARTALDEATADLRRHGDGRSSDLVVVFMHHTEVLSTYVALALADGPADTYARLNR